VVALQEYPYFQCKIHCTNTLQDIQLLDL